MRSIHKPYEHQKVPCLVLEQEVGRKVTAQGDALQVRS